jgi:patatin-like phospholipase/acyl hydrolase
MTATPPEPTRHFNIISLDGGGVRGTIEAVIIDRLSKEYPKLLRDVDLVAGTSTGGIQALGLAAGTPPPETRDLYEKTAKNIFADCFLDDFRDLWKLNGADYSNKNMKKILQMQFGDKTLAELDKKVIIPTFDLDNGYLNDHRSWKLKAFHNFTGADSDGDEKIVDVALRTSAAPTYFPTIDGYCDGGVIVNNPSMVAVAQALDRRGGNQQLKDVKVLSIGAGKFGRFIKGSNHDWGVAQWAPYLLYMMMEGGIDLVHFQTKQLLAERYHRINPFLDESFGIDDWKKIPKLVEIAENVDLAPTIAWLEEHWQ